MNIKNKPPAYVPIIMDGNIRLRGDLSIIKKKENKIVKNFFGDSSMSFAETGKSYFENIDLLEKLMGLNSLGVVFGEDYKQAYSPAEFMRELQTIGILRTSFVSISWSGLGKWSLQENPVEQKN